VVAASGESQEVESVVEVDDGRLVLVEGKTSGRQPFGEPCFDVVGFLLGVTERYHIVGVSHQHWGISFDPLTVTAVVSDPSRLL
jgi:hypothetical protein